MPVVLVPQRAIVTNDVAATVARHWHVRGLVGYRRLPRCNQRCAQMTEAGLTVGRKLIAIGNQWRVAHWLAAHSHTQCCPYLSLGSAL